MPKVNFTNVKTKPAKNTKIDWSPQQKSIFDWFANGDGNLVVRARAGTGKTTTILEGVKYANDRKILLAAFNKRIAQELSERLQGGAEAKTLHGLGFGFIRRMWDNVKVDTSKDRAAKLSKQFLDGEAPDTIVRLVSKLHTLGRECHPLAQGPHELVDLAWRHDCVPDPEWEEEGYTLDTICEAAYNAMQAAKEYPADGMIDFADMLFLPVVNNWIRPRYDLVCIDEAQDMNYCQLLIATRVAKGRIVVVGDDRQAIYGFRGADSNSVDRLKQELQAQELGLTVTYRCGKKIVEQAKLLVTDYEAHDSSPDGTVQSIGIEKLFETAKIGDAVLSRKNAPLMGLCLAALKQNIPARIEGRDVAAGLRALIKKIATGSARSSMPDFLAKLSKWELDQTERAAASLQRAEEKVEVIRDKVDALRALAENAKDLNELYHRLEQVFSGVSSGRCIVLSSVHKAKGLEWDNVFLLTDTFTGWGGKEQDNIRYVAITRAKSTLTWVGGEPV